ncbi:formyltetrahydrofolate deformylase [Sciscionella sediminilitoris]|uniref:formyltetrahydrofolate deformylase n=1 Tax=Sciscionella sediminilitoris TaxID=1445613 RepID=UPI0004DF6D24|nr:formyltetrahydrofolate deformylase [Sciscionella sp. SE31]
MDNGFVLTLTCAEQPGIVHAVTGYLVEHNCDIVEHRQFDSPRTDRLFMRMQFVSKDENIHIEGLRSGFADLAARYGMQWDMHESTERSRVLLMVSKYGHCLNDLLYRWSTGQLRIDIPAVVSNHRDFQRLVESYGIPFIHIPVTKDNKPQAEAELYSLIQEYRIDLTVLARYMQVLSDEMCKLLEGRVINIHHSFLPSFKGAKPYHQAYDRGVKLVGATAHYVTPDLDEGPIIDQEVIRVDHVSTPEELVVVGRDAERLALARAVQAHVEHRVLIDGLRTVVFS